jgi:uncharacterized protein (DUF1778 family)
MNPAAATKPMRLNIRASAEQKAVIEKAAKLLKTTVSSFVLQRAVEDAQAVLADENRFTLSKRQWDEFQQALDAPPRPLPALKRLLKSKGVFDG